MAFEIPELRLAPIGLASPNRSLFFVLMVGILMGIPGIGDARKPADVFKRQIILSPKAFPSSFKSDRAFIRHMKKVRTRRLVYPASNRMTIRFMAFFSRPFQVTEFTALLYDMTDRGRLVATVPISPNQRATRVLASAFDFERSEFPEEHQYRLIIAIGTRALAETRFTIKESRKNRAARKAKERQLRKGRSVDFSKPGRK